MSLQTPLMAMRVKTDIFAGSIALRIANDGIAQRSAADSFKLQSTTYGGGGSPSRAGCTDVYIEVRRRGVAALTARPSRAHPEILLSPDTGASHVLDLCSTLFL